MVVDFRRNRVEFPKTTGTQQERFIEFEFPSIVRRAEPVLNGFSIEFANSDHHLHKLVINTFVERVAATKVTVKVQFLLRDNSGTIDDAYQGFADVVLLVTRD